MAKPTQWSTTGWRISINSFNKYTNDQPTNLNAKYFLYADDLTINSQKYTFEEVEKTLTLVLREMSMYYKKNHLRPNLNKTQTCSFYLRNRNANRELKIELEDMHLEYSKFPKYLGVTLDKPLTFKKRCENTRDKVYTRNNIRKLVYSKWDADANTLRTSAIVLSYSAAEYVCPVWKASAHAKNIDIVLNESCRIITGCLRPTEVHKLHTISGIASPDIRRTTITEIERYKCNHDSRHPLHGYKWYKRRFPDYKTRKTKLWKERNIARDYIEPIWTRAMESLPPGPNLKYEKWKHSIG